MTTDGTAEPSDRSAAQHGAAETARGPRTGLVVTLIGIATSLVLLAGYGLNFAYDFWPSLKPDPGSHQRAWTRAVAIEPRVALIDYLERIGDPEYTNGVLDAFARQTWEVSSVPTQRQLDCQRRRVQGYHGYVVYARVHVEGLKRRNVTVAAMLYDVDDRHRLDATDLPIPVPYDILSHRLSSPTDEFVQAVFVERPRPGQRIFARIELRADDGTLLAIANSHRFRGFAVPSTSPPKRCPA